MDSSAEWESCEPGAKFDVRFKHYDEAAEAYGGLAGEWPEKRWYRFRHGVALAGSYGKAVDVLEALHSAVPPPGVACAKLGLAYRQLGEVQTAVQFFNEARMLDQFEPVALAQLAEIRAIQGRYDKAAIYLQRLEQVDGAEANVRRLSRMITPTKPHVD